jgi:dienelactone hydrolase
VIDDYAAAVQYRMSRPDVDPDRVSLVGVCMGAAFAVALAAREKRLRAVVSIAGGYNIGETFQSAFGVEDFAGYLTQVNALVQQQ